MRIKIPFPPNPLNQSNPLNPTSSSHPPNPCPHPPNPRFKDSPVYTTGVLFCNSAD